MEPYFSSTTDWLDVITPSLVRQGGYRLAPSSPAAHGTRIGPTPAHHYPAVPLWAHSAKRQFTARGEGMALKRATVDGRLSSSVVPGGNRRPDVLALRKATKRFPARAASSPNYHHASDPTEWCRDGSISEGVRSAEKE